LKLFFDIHMMIPALKIEESHETAAGKVRITLLMEGRENLGASIN
jgi:hypothetical protein